MKNKDMLLIGGAALLAALLFSNTDAKTNVTGKPKLLPGGRSQKFTVDNPGVNGISGLSDQYHDPVAAREIELYADNDGDLYRQQKRYILINLSKKHKKGIYDVEKAAKLWRYFIDSAMQKYNKEFGSRGDRWFDLLDTHDRQLLALEYAIATKDEFDLGNYTEK